jgi:hypothetical protein
MHYAGQNIHIDNDGYLVITSTGEFVHETVWEFHYGKIPSDKTILHRDRDRTNNEIWNLRLIKKSVFRWLHLPGTWGPKIRNGKGRLTREKEKV